MEWIKISQNKIKVMLTAEDAARYALPSCRSQGETLTKKAFRAILQDMRSEADFDATEDKVYVQLYPSRTGGFELFITKMGVSMEKTAQDEPSTYTKERDREVALRFSTLEALIAVCRRLTERGFCGESRAYLDDKHRYWLLLSEALPRDKIRTDYRFALEYGELESADSAKILLAEHAKCLCRKEATAQIGRL